MAETCFDKCVKYPASSLSSSDQLCLAKCLDRYNDAFNSVQQSMQSSLQEAQNMQ